MKQRKGDSARAERPYKDIRSDCGPQPGSEEHDGLVQGDLEAGAAAGVGTDELIVHPHHIAPRLGELGPVPVVGPRRKTFLLLALYPAHLEFRRLPALRASESSRLCLRCLYIESTLIHNATSMTETMEIFNCSFQKTGVGVKGENVFFRISKS